jgi:hypothetical protein
MFANTSTLVPNPFFGVSNIASAISSRSTIEIGQLLRPFPEFGNVNMTQSTLARSQYNAAIFQVRKRVTGLWGGSFSYTYSRLNDNQVNISNYYTSAPGVQNNYEFVPGSPYFNPDAEYGRSLLDSPHKVVIAPTVMLPFGNGKKIANSTLGDLLLGGWSITPVITLQSGFPMGVTQFVSGTAYLYGGTLRPNIVPGQDFLTAGNITDRIEATTCPSGCTTVGALALNQFGNAPRTLPGVYSPWRNNVDLGVSKNIRTGGSTSAQVRLEVLNMFNIIQWAALASSQFGNSSFGQENAQANNMRMVQFTFRYQF